MAIGASLSGNCDNGAKQSVCSASARGTWIIANDDSETAQSAGDLLSPAAIDDSVFHWVRVGPNVTRCLVRARQILAANTITGTGPVVRVFAAYGNPDSNGAMANDGTVEFQRLDNVDWNAAGIQLTLSTNGSGLNQDATYAYSDSMPSLDGIDLKGAWYVGVAVETAAVASTGTVPIELLFLN